MKRLSTQQINRLRSVLDMWYLPSELAEETGLSIYTLYKRYLPAGLPHRRDEAGHIWIRGTEFVEWVKQRNATARSATHTMRSSQAYCFVCRQPVEMVGELSSKPSNKYLEIVTGRCAQCGGKVTRARKRNGKS